ncbi:MAG: IS1182 family transposase [bacterium]|nr:IS1182 family transposase [bacterium]
MSGKFQPINRDTAYLLPPSLQDWLPDKHLARFVVDVVDQLDLSELVKRYGGGGKQPYHPALLLGLLFYGYATGTFSSRKLEQATYDSVAFRFITGDTHPDHDTIATFRKRFLSELEGLFVQMLVVAKVMGVFKLGKVSLDGTKMKANASKHKAMSWGYANKLEEQLRQEVRELLRRAELADAEDEPEIDIPDELARREDRIEAIKKAKKEIERRAQERFEAEQADYEAKLKRRKDKEEKTGKKARGCEPKAPEAGPRDKDQVNFTDEESRIMPSSEGFVQGYNAQAAVDIDSHLIVENHITQQSNDKQEVEPTLKGLKESETVLGKAEGLLADAGYFSADNVAHCEAAEMTPYISDHRERHNLTWDERFKIPPPCPEDADAVTAMAHRLRTPEGKAIYAKRKSTVETVFGIIKEVMGFRRFHLRGLDAAQGEWNLVCMAWNLKRIYALGS